MDQENKEKLLVTNSKKGTNQVAVGSYNERLVLQLVREHGELSKAEATRATGPERRGFNRAKWANPGAEETSSGHRPVKTD